MTGTDARRLLPAILELHDRIRTSVVSAFAEQRPESLSDVADDGAGDTIYAVDRVSEETLVEGLEHLARDVPLVLVAEGLPPAGLVLPRGTRDDECRWRILVDPIDGTRGLM
jgi:3'-phosphoadenosine 5'-phosphosulfate (PAPS) 3'-phosphatase